MLENILAPFSDWGLLILRVALGTHILALGFAADMLVAIVRARLPMGAKFTSGEAPGWELEFILAAVALALLFTGAGSIALDPIVGL